MLRPLPQGPQDQTHHGFHQSYGLRLGCGGVKGADKAFDSERSTAGFNFGGVGGGG